MSSQLKKILHQSLYVSQPIDWLTSRFHFSFSEYYDPSRTNFGVLRVMNDDQVTPLGGFPTHPHSNMEIISYVVDGSLTHKDSMGSKETIGRGSVQYMSAGTGVRHSEFNESEKEMLRFIQIWIEPHSRGLKPNYGSQSYKPEERLNRFLQVVKGTTERQHGERAIPINQDANIFVSEVESDKSVPFVLEKGRQAYLLCIEGKSEIVDNGNSYKVEMEARDALQIMGPISLDLKTKSSQPAHYLVIEMKQSQTKLF